MVKQNYFQTLNAALESEGLVELWPTGININYGESTRVDAEDGSKYGRLISVYRREDGLYERPVHYKK